MIARVFERDGIPSVTLSSARDISERVRPPRTAFLNYPLGYQTGHPHAAEEQRSILRAALRLAETAQEPGSILDLPFAWDEPDWEAETIDLYRRDAATVVRQRTSGEFQNGVHYAADECAEVCSLI